MELRKWGETVAVTAAAIALAASTAFADAGQLGRMQQAKGNMKAGPVKIHSGLELKESYDDNIYNVPRGEKEDFITTIAPGLLLDAGEKHKLMLGYSVDINRYSNHTSENSVNQIGRGEMELNLSSGFRFGLSDTYTRSVDQRAEERQTRARHRTNNFEASIGFGSKSDRFTSEIFYAQDYLKYKQEENKSLNRRDDEYGVDFYYRFLPKTSALVEYVYGIVDYIDSPDAQKDADSKNHTVNVGLKWDATALLNGHLKTGWKKKNYVNNEDAQGNKYTDEDLWAVDGDITYKMTENSKLNLVLTRAIKETTYAGNRADGYSKASNYTETGGELNIEAKMMDSMPIMLGGGYWQQKYNMMQSGMKSRKDKLSEINAGIGVEFGKYTSMLLKYTYSDADSNDDNKDELHNKVMLSLRADL